MQKGQETYPINSQISEEGYLQLRRENIELSKQNAALAAELLYYKQELAQLKRMIFGSKSERHIGNDPSQLSLGLDAEQAVQFEKEKEKESEQITYTRDKPDNKKGYAVRLALPIELNYKNFTLNLLQLV